MLVAEITIFVAAELTRETAMIQFHFHMVSVTSKALFTPLKLRLVSGIVKTRAIIG